MVLDHRDQCTQEHCRLAQEAGLIEWSVDIEGYIPVPTQKYIDWQNELDWEEADE